MDIAAWRKLELDHRIVEGNRNEVWKGSLAGQTVAVRQSRRSDASLLWELELLQHLDALGFRVPVPLATNDGDLHHDGIVVQRWLTGEPPASESDWALVAAELQRLHKASPAYSQRPDCCVVTELTERRRSVDADLDAMPEAAQQLVSHAFSLVAAAPIAVIHGDPHSSNIRIQGETVGLLDWDESRVDVTWHDLSELEAIVLAPDELRIARRLSNAWEAANGWVAEPEYARRRLANLQL